MQTYVLPQLGDIPVDKVGTHIAAVLRWAALREHRPNDNPVSTVLAELPKRTTVVRHHAALHYSEVGAALRRIDTSTIVVPANEPGTGR